MAVSDPVEERLYGTLLRYTSEPTARGILRRARQQGILRTADPAAYFDMVMFGARLFVEEPRRERLVAELSKVCYGHAPDAETAHYELRIVDEHSSRRARMLVRRLVQQAGCRDLLAVRAATAVSELARNALAYAGGGTVQIDMHTDPRRVCVIVSDQGPGIPNLEEVLSGAYRSRTGLGRGLAGVKKLASRFHIQTDAAGTVVEFEITL